MLLNTRPPQQIQYLDNSVYPLMKVYIYKLDLRIHRRMIYPLKTRSGSTDIAGIENVSKANWARTGNYCIFPFHNFIASKDSFAYGESSIDNGASRYLVNSSCTCLVALNRHLLTSNGETSDAAEGEVGDVVIFRSLLAQIGCDTTFHSLCIPLQLTINQTSVDRYQPNQPALDSGDISESPSWRA